MSDSLPLVHIDQLQIGMFVSLDMAWLEHPFLVNSFLIKNEKQLATLREIGLRMVSYDPQRSDAQPLPLEPDGIAQSTPKQKRGGALPAALRVWPEYRRQFHELRRSGDYRAAS